MHKLLSWISKKRVLYWILEKYKLHFQTKQSNVFRVKGILRCYLTISLSYGIIHCMCAFIAWYAYLSIKKMQWRTRKVNTERNPSGWRKSILHEQWRHQHHSLPTKIKAQVSINLVKQFSNFLQYWEITISNSSLRTIHSNTRFMQVQKSWGSLDRTTINVN